MSQFEKLQKQAGEPLAPGADPPKTLPPAPKGADHKKFSVPSLKELGYNAEPTTPYKVYSPHCPLSPSNSSLSHKASNLSCQMLALNDLIQ